MHPDAQPDASPSHASHAALALALLVILSEAKNLSVIVPALAQRAGELITVERGGERRVSSRSPILD